MNMLEKIQSQLEHLSKSERKVAEVILASPDNAIHSSIAAMALEANVSEPTVNRFCRSMDTRGFPDFKLHLAQSLANGNSLCLIAMSMKMTALNHTQGKYLSPQWQRLIMSVIHWINLPSTAPSTCSLRQKKSPFSD
ncbi:putative hex-regulon repressor (RpiR-family transcriptional regulator) [Escherichia coli]|nr:putative hex-regulon repressor (RpiR-family transcriptional regulator) [Escherichia coli]